jgi:hypothetical protein
MAVVEGPPARVLVGMSQDADLLVVGTRGMGGFRGLLESRGPDAKAFGQVTYLGPLS